MSELTTQQAADAALNLGKQLRAVIQVGEFLESIASLEQRKAEAEAAAAAAVAAGVDASASAAKLQSVVDELQAKKGTLQVEIDKLLDDAQAKAERIVVDAEVEAESIIAVVNAERDGLRSRVAQDRAAHDANLTAWTVEEKALEKRVASLKAEIANIKKNLIEAETGE